MVPGFGFWVQGFACEGRYLLRPGMAAYTDRGVFTTACFSNYGGDSGGVED